MEPAWEKSMSGQGSNSSAQSRKPGSNAHMNAATAMGYHILGSNSWPGRAQLQVAHGMFDRDLMSLDGLASAFLSRAQAGRSLARSTGAGRPRFMS